MRTQARGWSAARLVIPFVFVLFFSSGFAALLYQVIWQRVLAIFSGADVYSVTIIVAAFMAGLGIGSLVGGYLADRVSVGRRIALFAISEAAIAIFAFASLPIYYDLLYGQFSDLSSSPLMLALVLFLSLLWPTFFMGMSLPLLAKSLTTSVEGAARMVGALYGFNTLGAALGAFATAWFLIRLLGFWGTVIVGAGMNLFAALGAIAVAPWLLRERTATEGEQEATDEPAARQHEPAAPAKGWPASVWISIYAVSGFIALSLEIVWFRLLGTMLKSNAFTFSSLLTIYLLGLAAGTFRGIEWAKSTPNPARAFLGLQAGITLYAALSIGILTAALGNWGILDPLWVYFGSYDTFDFQGALQSLGQYTMEPRTAVLGGSEPALQFILLYVVLPTFLIGPPTLMMGMSFPLLQRVVQRDVAHLGRRVGWLQTANIFGSMLGAVLTGWVFLRFLGTTTTLQLLLVIGGIWLALLAREWAAGSQKRLVLAGVGAAAVLLTALWAVPSPDTLWAKLHGTMAGRVIAQEDGSGLAVLKRENEVLTAVYANGLGQSTIPFPVHHTDLGMLPALVHPNPEDIAIIGLGSGATLHGASGRPETERIDCIEIIAPQLSALHTLQARNPYGGLETLLGDERINFIFADGREVIMHGGRQYDIIEADALRPTSAYAGNLYSREYFMLLKKHLKPGGFAVTWAPTARTASTFVSVFPYVLSYTTDNNMLIGSNEPIEWDVAKLRERAAHPFTKEYYESAGVDLDKRVEVFAESEVGLIGPDRPRNMEDTNSDLYPKDEYLVP
jgi:spermidine synthase